MARSPSVKSTLQVRIGAGDIASRNSSLVCKTTKNVVASKVTGLQNVLFNKGSKR